MTVIQPLLNITADVDKSSFPKSSALTSDSGSFSDVLEKAKNSFDSNNNKIESFSEKDLKQTASSNQNSNQVDNTAEKSQRNSRFARKYREQQANRA